MSGNIRKKYIFFIMLIVAFLGDGELNKLFSPLLINQLGNGKFMLLPGLFLLATIYLPNDRWMALIAIVVGVLYDLYYSGLIGINLIIFFGIVYFLPKLIDLVPDSWIFVLLFYVIIITCSLIIGYVINLIIGTTSMDVVSFVSFVLAPNLFFNTGIFLLLYYPTTKLFKKMIG